MAALVVPTGRQAAPPGLHAPEPVWTVLRHGCVASRRLPVAVGMTGACRGGKSRTASGVQAPMAFARRTWLTLLRLSG